jgi:hypothetical protein
VPNIFFVYELVTFPPLPPTLSSPPNGATDQATTVTLDWNISAGATSYQVQVSTDTSFTQIIVDTSGLTVDAYVVSGLANSTQYWWRVRATNAGGTSNWSTVWSFTTTVAAPPPPVLVSPGNGSTNQPIPVILDWNASPGATSYQVQVSTDASFTQIIEDTSGLTVDVYVVSGLANNTQYWWRVRATNTGGTSNWSPVWNFSTIVAAPPPPVLVSPVDGATNQPIPVTLDWNVSPGAASYQVQVSTDASFTQIIEDTSGLTVDTYMVSGLANSTRYWWRVRATNTGGTSNWSISRSFSTSIVLNPPPADTANVDLSATVSLALPPGTPTVAESLFYRRAGETAYGSTPMTRNADSINGIVPGDFVTLRGVEYYVKVTVPGGQEIFVNTSGNPGVIRVAVGTIPSPLTQERVTYKMVSVPLSLQMTGVKDVLDDDFGEYDPRLWRLFRWEGGAYQEYLLIDSSFSPGTSFWLISHEGKSFDVDGGLSVDSDNPFTITLQPGWNQIASPFAFRTMWDTTGLSGVSLPSRFDGVEYQMPTNVLEPWDGYFVENTGTSPIQVSVQPREIPLGKVPATPSDGEGSDFELRLAATLEGSGFMDSHNYVGLHPDARTGRDRFDIAEPPAIGDNLGLSVIDGTERFMRNVKPPTDEGHFWDFLLTSSIAGRAHVALTQSGEVPAGFSIFVLDNDRFMMIPIEENSFLAEVENAAEVRSFRVIIGTGQFAEANSGGIPLVPLSYLLEQNFPNPFNPETTIRYQLSERTHVLLEVFNILGQRVKTLVNEEQVTGLYSAIWRGDNIAGSPVGSGVYFYRLTTREFVSTRKLVLIR